MSAQNIMKIIVTGANGQLGTEIRRRSRNTGHTFVFTDVQQLDITDKSAVSAAITPDVDIIINCAAYTDVNAAETSRETADRLNVSGPANLAEAAAASGALLIHISTDYIFDGRSDRPYTEETLPNPLNYYGLTKMKAEQEIIRSGCRYMIFRTSWMYSTHGKNFFLTMNELTSSRQEINVVNDQTGTPTSASDLASFLCHIIEKDLLDRTGIYNYSNEGSCTWFEFADSINSMMGHTCRVLPCRTADFPSPAERPAYSVLDKSKVKRTFDIEIPHWRDSLVYIIKEYKESHK